MASPSPSLSALRATMPQGASEPASAIAQGLLHGAAPGQRTPPDARPADAALLKVDGVSLEYRTPERVVRATHRVSFELHESERFVLLGPSAVASRPCSRRSAVSSRRWKARSGSTAAS